MMEKIVWPMEPPPWFIDEELQVCSLCLGTGFVVTRWKNAAEYIAATGEKYLKAWKRDALNTGKYESGEPCRCRTEGDRLRRLGTVDRDAAAELRGANFGNIRGPENKIFAARALKDFIKVFLNDGTEGDIFVLAGPSGTGKTYLAYAAAHAVVDGRRTANVVTAAQLCDGLRERAYDTADQNAWIAEIKADLFILDDLGAERIGVEGGVVETRFGEFLKAFDRGGFLIITTNHTDLNKALAITFKDDGPRIATRLTRRLFNGRIYQL